MILVSACTTSLNFSGSPAGSLLKILTITSCAAAMPRFKVLPRSLEFKAVVVGEGRADAAQDAGRIEGSRDGVGGAQRPGLHRAVMKRVGEHEQTRHGPVGIMAQLVANPLHALGGAQVDVDHDA